MVVVGGWAGVAGRLTGGVEDIALAGTPEGAELATLLAGWLLDRRARRA